MFAEFPNIPQPQGNPSGQPCPQCRRPVATDQRYCLQCAAPLGGNRDELLVAVGLGDPPPVPSRVEPGHAVTTEPGAFATARPWTPRRVSPGVATVVTGVMLATGIAVGASAGGRAPQTVASAGELTSAQAKAAVIAALQARNAAAAATAKPSPTPTPAPAAPAPAPTDVPLAAPVVAASTPATTPVDTSSDTTDTSSTDDTATTPTTPDSTTALPNVTNVWVISVPATSINALDLPKAPASLLRDTITPQGVQLSGYSLLTATATDNQAALSSGQLPSATTPATTPASIDAQLTARGDVVRRYTVPADGDTLTADLAPTATAPSLSWITAPSDPATAATFTATTLAAIEALPAYTAGGLILILPSSPAAASPTDLAVGAVAISPFIPATTTNATAFGPYGVLRLLEDLFTLPATAGAGADDVAQVDRSIFESTSASGSRAHYQPTRSSS